MKLGLFLAVFTALLVIGIGQVGAQDTQPSAVNIGASSPSVGVVTFSGVITDVSTGDPVTGAVVQLVGKDINTVTDIDGRYELSAVVGNYKLSASFLGYSDYQVNLILSGSGSYDFNLTASALSLEEVTISDKRDNENIMSAVGGIEQLDIERLEQKSKFLGETDVIRSLQSLSGVSSAGEGSSGFNVRGGNTDENLIFQDGAFIINPVHALGFFSLFHPDMVKGVTLYKGDVPAKFGGRLSSVLDVKLREGDNQKFAVEGGLGVAASRLTVEGPIIKDKVSFIVGGRASYLDFLLKQVNDLDLRKSKAFFYDLTGKIDARLTKTTKIGGTFFTAFDSFQFAEDVKFEYETKTISGYLDQLVGDNININARINIGDYNSSLFDINGNDQSKFNNKVDYVRAGISGFYQINESLSLEIGAERNNYEVSPGTLDPIGSASTAKAQQLDIEKGNETAAYIQSTISLGDKFELLGGLRYVIYNRVGADDVRLYDETKPRRGTSVIGTTQFAEGENIIQYSGLEPRVSMRYTLNENSSIKLGYNRANQYFSQISNTASATPIDIWQLSNFHVGPQQADNFSIGYYRNFRDNTVTTELAVFYRNISNAVEYKDFADLLLNENIETELVTGIGKAFGLEFSLAKKYGKHRFEGNYTFSRALRKVEETPNQESVNNGARLSST